MKTSYVTILPFNSWHNNMCISSCTWNINVRIHLPNHTICLCKFSMSVAHYGYRAVQASIPSLLPSSSSIWWEGWCPKRDFFRSIQTLLLFLANCAPWSSIDCIEWLIWQVNYFHFEQCCCTGYSNTFGQINYIRLGGCFEHHLY